MLMPKDLIPYIVPAIIVVVIGIRLFRSQTPRKINPSRLWIGPVYIAAFMAFALATSPMPNAFALMLYAVAAALGIGTGYLRALHQEFSIDPGTGAIMSKASPIGMIVFVGIFLLRYAARYAMVGNLQPSDMRHGPNAQYLLFTDVGLFFAFAMVSATAWEIWRRTRPLAAEQAARTVPPAV
jgi:hypothetical protein